MENDAETLQAIIDEATEIGAHAQARIAKKFLHQVVFEDE